MHLNVITFMVCVILFRLPIRTHLVCIQFTHPFPNINCPLHREILNNGIYAISIQIKCIVKTRLFKNDEMSKNVLVRYKQSSTLNILPVYNSTVLEAKPRKQL